MKQILLLIGCLFLSFPAVAKLQEGTPAPEFSVMKDGIPVPISDYKDKIIIIEWVTEGCPFLHYYRGGNGFGGKLPGLKTATDNNIVWVSIVSDQSEKAAFEQNKELEQERNSKGFAGIYVLVDKTNKMTRLYGDKQQHPYITIIKNGVLAYQGHVLVITREGGNYCLIDKFSP